MVDSDGNAAAGMAIVGANTTNGSWFYSINNGTNWLTLGAVSSASARVLAADANTRLYFQPTANFNGTIADGLTFRAWDQSGGFANGASGVNTSTNGGTTPFSTPTDLAAITVTPVDDAPIITAQTAAIALAANTPRTIVFADLAVTDIDNAYPAGFTLTVANGGNYTHIGNTITPALNFVGTLDVPVTVNDGTLSSATFHMVVTVNPTTARAASSGHIVPQGVGYLVSFLGNPGATYTLQFTTALAPAPIVWQTLGTVTADASGLYSITNIPPANTPMRFYRATLP